MKEKSTTNNFEILGYTNFLSVQCIYPLDVDVDVMVA